MLDKIHAPLTGNGRLSPEESGSSETSLRGPCPQPGPVRAMVRAFMEGRDSAGSVAGPAEGRGEGSADIAELGQGGGGGELAAELEQLVGHMRSAFSAGKEGTIYTSMRLAFSAGNRLMLDPSVSSFNGRGTHLFFLSDLSQCFTFWWFTVNQ